MRTQFLLDLKAKTDQDRTLGKNPSDRLVRPTQELAKSITETNSKVREPKTYNEAINNSLNENKLQKIIDEEFWNLDTY